MAAPTSELAANALLVAAAPELLDALRRVLVAWRSVPGNVQVPDEINDDELWVAVAEVIASARHQELIALRNLGWRPSMSTRSLIAAKTDTGGYRCIYCHFDGYPSHHGPLLLEHYSDPLNLARLIQLGDLSALAEEIGEKHDGDDHTSHQDWCTAYHRDRGEPWERTRPDEYADLADLLRYATDSWAEYLYVWDGTAWQYAHLVGHGPGVVPESALSPLTPAAWEDDEEESG